MNAPYDVFTRKPLDGGADVNCRTRPQRLEHTQVTAQAIRGKVSWGGSMARSVREVIAALPAKRRAKIAAANAQKLIAEEQKLIAERKKRQLEVAKRALELDHNLIVIAVLITA